MQCLRDEKTKFAVGPLIVITGPTASGKSALGMKVAQKYDGEIICADSRTVYRGLNIGTAKPTAEDMHLVRHHLVDIVNPDQSFSAAQFKKMATSAIDDVLSRSKIPIIVGGTGLYVDSVIYDYEFGTPANLARRQELQQKSVKELQDICRKNNISLPENDKNSRHLVRTIELGGSVEQKRCIRNNTIVVGISVDKDVLRERVRGRIEQMFADDVLSEAKNVAHKYGWDSEAMTGNIYRICRLVLSGEIDVPTAVEKCIQSDMSLVKRQNTWFKRNDQIVWSENPEVLLEKIEQFITSQKK